MVKEKNKILIIDDDSFLLDMYALKFGQSNFEVSTALGSKQALGRLREGLLVDVILLDIIMPTLDGGEVLAQLRRDKKFSDLHAIFLTGLVTSEEIGHEGYEISGHPVIPKPVGAKEFRAVVAAQLGVK